MKTICLNMIVKNESAVIGRCLESVKHFLDYWVIADTGSTDRTREIILESLSDIPGELHDRPWVNFAHNRNEVLSYSWGKTDYILFLDADETLLTPIDKSALEWDYYLVRMIGKTSEFEKMFLIKNDPSWSWRGVLHESIENPNPVFGGVLTAAVEYDESYGQRSQDPEKFLKDAEVLKKALEKEPGNGRYLFYLAQSYAHAKEYSLALETYRERILHPGPKDELFWSLYCIGCLQQDLGMDPATVLASYSKAHQFDPTRAEPLYRLAVYLEATNPFLARLLTEQGAKLPVPTSGRSQKWIYKDLLRKHDSA